MTGMRVPPRPLSIAHRGASAYAPGNTIAAFRKAAVLGADMWEVDIRATGTVFLWSFTTPSCRTARRYRG